MGNSVDGGDGHHLERRRAIDLGLLAGGEGRDRPAVDAVAFTLPAGAVSDPIKTDNGAVVVKVVERKDVTPAELTTGKKEVRDQMLNERKNRFYGSYMTKAREKMRINRNEATIAQVTT